MNVAELIAKLETIENKSLEILAAPMVFLNHKDADGRESLRKAPNPRERFKIETVRLQVDFDTEADPASFIILGYETDEFPENDELSDEFIN